jgi:hypothetical protein
MSQPKRHHWPRKVDGAALQAGRARLSPLAALTTRRPLAPPWGNVRYRRNLAVAVPFGEGPFITRFADLPHRAVKVGGLLR